MDGIQQAHARNAEALAGLPPSELSRHLGEYALLFDGQVANYYATNREALAAGYRERGPLHFSVMRVDPQPAYLGFSACENYSW